MGSFRYCPVDGEEFHQRVQRCPDHDVPLVDSQPEVAPDPGETEKHDWVEVRRFGREMDAEMVRGFLESNGLTVNLWSGGMGRWRPESALTELTGVPSDFNAYRVMVPDDQSEIAMELLERADEEILLRENEPVPDERDPIGDTGEWMREPFSWMNLFRNRRWVLAGFGVLMLLTIVLGNLR